MTTLHIEHQINDFRTWKAAFDRFADIRTKAGVTTYRVRRLEDNAKLPRHRSRLRHHATGPRV